MKKCFLSQQCQFCSYNNSNDVFIKCISIYMYIFKCALWFNDIDILMTSALYCDGHGTLVHQYHSCSPSIFYPISRLKLSLRENSFMCMYITRTML